MVKTRTTSNLKGNVKLKDKVEFKSLSQSVK
jgi:hypothetical protein